MTVFICFGSLLACKSKPGTFSNSLKTPEEVVTVFCDLDGSGARLSSKTWQDIRPYITVPEVALESGVIIISGSDLKQINKTNKKAEILVEYKVLGKYRDRQFTPEQSTETIPVNVIKTDAGWKITNPETIVPHIYAQVFLEGLKD